MGEARKHILLISVDILKYAKFFSLI